MESRLQLESSDSLGHILVTVCLSVLPLSPMPSLFFCLHLCNPPCDSFSVPTPLFPHLSSLFYGLRLCPWVSALCLWLLVPPSPTPAHHFALSFLALALFCAVSFSLPWFLSLHNMGPLFVLGSSPGDSGNWIEIAYGTSSGGVRVIVQHPETVGSGPQLFQTFTVHRSPVTKIMLSEKHLISGGSPRR